jgi:hypothetical protein
MKAKRLCLHVGQRTKGDIARIGFRLAAISSKSGSTHCSKHSRSQYSLPCEEIGLGVDFVRRIRQYVFQVRLPARPT